MPPYYQQVPKIPPAGFFFFERDHAVFLDEIFFIIFQMNLKNIILFSSLLYAAFYGAESALF
jgi:hypothetical protein